MEEVKGKAVDTPLKSCHIAKGEASCGPLSNDLHQDTTIVTSACALSLGACLSQYDASRRVIHLKSVQNRSKLWGGDRKRSLMKPKN